MKNTSIAVSVFLLLLIQTFLVSCGEKSVQSIQIEIGDTDELLYRNDGSNPVSYTYYYGSNPGSIITLTAKCFDQNLVPIANESIKWNISNSNGDVFNVSSTDDNNNVVGIATGDTLNILLDRINTLSTYTFTATVENKSASLKIDVDVKNNIVPFLTIEHSASNNGTPKTVSLLTPSNIKLIKGHTYKLSLTSNKSNYPYGNLKWIIKDDLGTATLGTQKPQNQLYKDNNSFQNKSDIFLNLPPEDGKNIHIDVKAGDKQHYSFNIITVSPIIDESIESPTFYTEEIDDGYKIRINAPLRELNHNRVCELEKNNSGEWQEIQTDKDGIYEFNLTPALTDNKPMNFEYAIRMKDEETQSVSTKNSVKLKVMPSPLLVSYNENKYEVSLPSKDLSDEEWSDFTSKQLLQTVYVSLDTDRIANEENYVKKYEDSTYDILDSNNNSVLKNNENKKILDDNNDINKISQVFNFYKTDDYKKLTTIVHPIKGYAKRSPVLSEDTFEPSSIYNLNLFTRLEFIKPNFDDETKGFYQIRIHNSDHSLIKNTNWLCVVQIDDSIYKTITPNEMVKNGNDYLILLTDDLAKPLAFPINSNDNKIRTMLIPTNNIESKITYAPTTGMGDKKYLTTNDAKVAPIPHIDVSDAVQPYANKRIAKMSFNNINDLKNISIEYALNTNFTTDYDALNWDQMEDVVLDGDNEIIISEKEEYSGYLYVRTSNITSTLNNYIAPYVIVKKVSLSLLPLPETSNITSSSNYVDPSSENGSPYTSYIKSCILNCPYTVLVCTYTDIRTSSEGHNGGGGSGGYSTISGWSKKDYNNTRITLVSSSVSNSGQSWSNSAQYTMYMVGRKQGYIDRGIKISSSGYVSNIDKFPNYNHSGNRTTPPNKFGFKTNVGSDLWNY